MALRMDGSKAEILADKDDNDFFIMINGGPKKVVFSVCQPLSGKRWLRAVDTALHSPEDILLPGSEKELTLPDRYTIQARSIAILISKDI
jgi:glycogen operon protein